MRNICLLTIMVLIAGDEALASSYRSYQSTGNDVAKVDLSLDAEENFELSCAFIDDESLVIYRGKYREWENVFDLTFTDKCIENRNCQPITRKILEDDILHLSEGFLRGSDIIRMNKKGGDLFLCGTNLEPTQLK